MILTPDDPRSPVCARMEFRHWRADDVGLAMSLWGDPRVTRYLSASGVFERSDVEARVARELTHQAAHGIQYWPLFLRESGGFVGCCGLKPYDLPTGILELGFHFSPEHWGRGLATEAARAVITFAFDTLRAEALFAGHHPENAASQRALERIGFTYSHHELFPPTGLDHPGYMLKRSR
jgi:[ribosomal protein S5]-alanine N-acetyltransferase